MQHGTLFGVNTINPQDESNKFCMTLRIPNEVLNELSKSKQEMQIVQEFKFQVGDKQFAVTVHDEKVNHVDCYQVAQNMYTQLGTVYKKAFVQGTSLDTKKIKQNTIEKNKKDRLSQVIPDKTTKKAPKKPSAQKDTKKSWEKPLTSLGEKNPILATYDSARAVALRSNNIDSMSEYEQSVEQFQKKYKQYSVIDSVLCKNKEQFQELYQEYESSNDSSKPKIKEYMSKLYHKRKPEVEKLTQFYNVLHEELAQLKQMVADFVAAENARMDLST